MSGRPGSSCPRSVSSLAALYVEVLAHPLIVLLQDTVILTQRESLPFLRQQDTPQVGVSGELNAEHIVGLALQPVGGPPNGSDRSDRLVLGDGSFQAQLHVMRERVELVDDLEALFFLRIVYGREIGEHVVLLVHLEEAADL